jgi:hypothetical protein
MNTRPMEVSINITNNINFNLFDQILSSNNRTPGNIGMKVNTNDHNGEEKDDNDDNESETDQDTDLEDSDAAILTLSTSDDNEDDRVE